MRDDTRMVCMTFRPSEQAASLEAYVWQDQTLKSHGSHIWTSHSTTGSKS